ncbi:MAG: ABC transporter permease subunit [Anaerolineales bacterium]|jgi:ABC-2 type transport system permease protein
MAGNSAFELVSERGWRRGLNNLLDNELAHWWKTRRWWTQCLIWVGVVGFMLAAVIFSDPNSQFADGVMLYSIFAGLFPAIGVIILMQGALVGEKQDGTAAWVLSKPASRPAFILSKLAANSLGVLVTMVLVPGIVAYILLSYSQMAALDPLPFLAAWAVIFLIHFFYLTLTLMLGALFSGRGPVIGIALAFLFLQQYLVGLLPLLRYLLPWTLAVPLNDQTQAVVPALLQGQPVYSWIPVAAVLLESILFVLVALRRFEQEEF